MDDPDDTEPALEINHELTAKLPEELLKRDLKQGKLGPPIIKHNSVSVVVLDAESRRVYVGMQQGDLFWWDLRRYRNALLFGSHSPHRRMGAHKGCVTALCPLQPSAAIHMPLLVSGSSDCTLLVWDPKRGNSVEPAVVVQTLYKHTGTVTAVMAFNACLLSASTDRTIRLWQVSANRQQMLYPAFEQVRIIATMPAWVTSLSSRSEAFQAGKENAVYATDAHANIIRIEAFRNVEREGDVSRANAVEVLNFVVGPGAEDAGPGVPVGAPAWAVNRSQDRGILFAAFNRDHAMLLTSSWDNCVRVYETMHGELLATFVNEHAVVFVGAVYDAHSKQIVTVDKLGYMAIYCPMKHSMVASKRVTTLEGVDLQQVPETDVYMVVSTHDVAFWKVDRDVDYNIVRAGHSGPVVSVYTCTGGVGQVLGEIDFRVFSASSDNTIRLWDPVKLACLSIYRGVPSELSCMLFFEAWNTVVTGHDGGEVVLWDAATGTRSVMRHHGNTVSSMDMGVVYKDVELLITGSYDGTIGLWDVRRTPGVSGQKSELLFKWAAHGARDEAVTVEGGVLPPRHMRPEIRCVLFHPQLKLLLSGGNDCRIKAWDAGNSLLVGELLTHSEPITCFAFEGYFLFSGSEDCSIRVWDLATLGSVAGVVTTVRDPVFTLLGHTRTVTALTMLARTGALLSCSLDGQLIFWDYVAQAQLHKFTHTEEMLCMAVRVDTDEVLVGTQECNILRFALGDGEGSSSAAGSTAAGRDRASERASTPLLADDEEDAD